jgi:hypothetical protein
MDPVQEHGELTQNILSFVNTQVGSFGDWQNVPGGLTMVQASTAGYVWGVNTSNQIYVCKQPCAGGWVPVDMTGVTGTVQSMQVDATYIYILVTVGTTQLVAYHPIDGSGSWTTLTNGVSGSPIMKTLGVTQTFLWVSGTDPSKNAPVSYRCTKPCSTNAWIQETEINQSLGSLSSSGSKLYGTTFDPTLGKSIAFSADESGTNLEQVAGLAGVQPAAISAQSDQTTLLVAGMDNSLYGCTAPCNDPAQAYKIDTQGYAPLTSSPNPVSAVNNQLWMVSASNGANGNIFARLDVPDATSILQQVNALDSSRESIAHTLENDWKVQTATLGAQREISSAMNALGDAMSMDKQLAHAQKNAGVLKRSIEGKKAQVDTYSSKLYPIQILAIALLAAVLVYLVLGAVLPASATQALVALVVTVGFGATIYFYVTNNTDGKSTVQSILPSP